MGHRRLRGALLTASVAFVIAPAATALAAPATHRVEIRRTTGGIPHIKAKDWASLGYGVQYDEEFDGENFSFDASATGFKAIAGWRFIDWLAVEANYVDLGSGDDNVQGQRIESDVNGVALSAVGFVPIGPVDLFARVGAVNWNADRDRRSVV